MGEIVVESLQKNIDKVASIYIIVLIPRTHTFIYVRREIWEPLFFSLAGEYWYMNWECEIYCPKCQYNCIWLTYVWENYSYYFFLSAQNSQHKVLYFTSFVHLITCIHTRWYRIVLEPLLVMLKMITGTCLSISNIFADDNFASYWEIALDLSFSDALLLLVIHLHSGKWNLEMPVFTLSCIVLFKLHSHELTLQFIMYIDISVMVCLS